MEKVSREIRRSEMCPPPREAKKRARGGKEEAKPFLKSEKSSSYFCHSAIAAPMSNTFNFIRLDARVFEWSIVNKQNPWYQHQKIKATYKMIHPKDLKT